MATEIRAACPENDALVEYMKKWWKELSDKNPNKCSPNLESNVKKAFTNVCRHKSPIITPQDFQSVKGVGKWLTREMRDFFKIDFSGNDCSPAKGKKARGTRTYLPQKNSVAYALLIALYRGEKNGVEHMLKQELIDEAEASGLSRGPIAPERGKGKPGVPGQIASSGKEWYSGWSAMGKLIDKGLVDKSSCPAKYKLSDEGRRVAVECLSRSGMLDSAQVLVKRDGCSDSDKQDAENLTLGSASSPQNIVSTSVHLNTNNVSKDEISAKYFEKFTSLGYSIEQVLHAWTEVSTSSPNQEMSTLWLAVMCRLREDEVYGVQSVPRANVGNNCGDASTSNRLIEGQQNLTCGIGKISDRCTKSPANSDISAASLRSENQACKTLESCPGASQNVLRMPPLKYIEKFNDAYKVILVLDDREQFTRSNSRNIIQKIGREFQIEIQVRRLPVGDGIWIARHKQLHTEYVLDFIVERKNVDDLRSSIRDNRYRDQKLRLLRTGIKKIIYLVEGDPNACEGADAVKTACFTTEILEGFDVQRTSGLSDTLHRYGHLTLAIADQYQINSSLADCNNADQCLLYNQFIKKCNDVDKLTVSDVFATQLMQVPQVTEEVAVAVVYCYPTLYSLALAYAPLDGDVNAQEELLIKASNGVINSAASRNIFRFIWAS